MKRNFIKILSDEFLLSLNRYSLTIILSLFICTLNYSTFAQNTITVKGKVVSEQQEAVYGATIKLAGNKSIGTITDIDGKFLLQLPEGKHTLIVSYIGMETQEIVLNGKTNITVTLKDDTKQLSEVIVVGYGQQKKESVVGSIAQTSAKTLERQGGVSNLGQALTGNLPGVVTTTSTGMPGAEDPKIVIRTVSSWNNSDPLVLIDGVERSMSSIDISSVESISVLKDASATSIYGVKGANGVILITTKRGVEGKANIQVRSNYTVKSISQLPGKLDSYDALLLKNQTVERELPLYATGWSLYTPKEIIEKYRNPANSAEWDQYPNVDWISELFNNYATSYNTSVNVSGGTKAVKYFSSIDFLHEGDLFKDFGNNRGYNAGYGYNRLNVRSNLDFDLTKTTKFSANLFGSNGVRTLPYDFNDNDATYWNSAYLSAPDAMRPVYSDGTWGFYSPRNADVPNSVYFLANSGVEKRTTTQINTDFTLKQSLDMLLKGLELKVSLSMDNSFREKQRGVNDTFNSAQRKWIDPANGSVTYEQFADAGTKLDFTNGVRWTTASGNVDKTQTYRKVYYSGNLNYNRKFGKHDVGLLGVFSREQSARGSEFLHFREDWAYRVTYAYASKYFFETNGAYNGSEKFSSEKRFAFFPSVSLGWMLTEEKFMNALKFVDMLKFRASWGLIGDDNVTQSRWLYQDQWSYGGNTQMGQVPSNTPYTYYRLSSLGNNQLSWETVEKKNFGVDYAFFNGLLTGAFDLFNDYRYDILISGGSRAVPSYFGATAPVANLGEVVSKGYEVTLKLNKKLNKNTRFWVDVNLTHATNEIKFSDDPEFKPSYQKGAGYAIGQTRTYLDQGFLTSWDDVYGSTSRATNNQNKLAGDYNIIDFNGDGVIDDNDRAPYQYSSTPQNTYNTTVGFEWKGFSCFLQFYGVNNVTREVYLPTFRATSDVAYEQGIIWTKTSGGEVPLPRWSSTQGSEASGTRYLYDGSYLRLKNAEIAYTFSGGWVSKLGVKNLKIYMNGNNLFLWTKMPDDRESNYNTSAGSSSGSAYPTVKRYNVGIDITL